MIFSILAFVALILSILIKDRKKSLFIQSINCLCESIYCLWQSNMKLVRISGITTGILYGLYYLCYQSWFIFMGDIILLFTSIISIYKNDIKINKTKKFNNNALAN